MLKDANMISYFLIKTYQKNYPKNHELKQINEWNFNFKCLS